MTLFDLQTQVNVALKSGNAVRVSTLRFLIAAVKNAAIQKYGSQADTKLSEADIVDAVKKLIKTHKESIEAFTNAGRVELAQKEQAELTVLEEFAPKEMSDEELRALLAPIAATGGDFGPLMGKAMAVVKGQADGGRVSAVLKSLLTK